MVGRLVALTCAAALLAPAVAQAELPGGRAIAVATSLSPDVHLFADPVVAETRVIVDPREFDPDGIRVKASFAPYEQVGPLQESRRRVGDAVELRYAATLRCLDGTCLAPRHRTQLGEQEGGRSERYTFRFPPAEVLYEHPSGRVELLLQRPFSALEVVSRINTAQLDAATTALGTYTASLEPPSPTYRLSAGRVAAGAFALAGLLLLLPGWLAGRSLLRRWRSTRQPRRLSPVERALLLVDWTGQRQNGQEDRRRALEALAEVLEHSGAAPLAETTRTLAWSEEGPDRTTTGELASEARSVLERGNGRSH
ncbi:MAG TPA: hypothetical protein VFR32_05200 [Gaiellaceae bacterium]|nr:hypothetical protein [Gaiellaceae bacterium]